MQDWDSLERECRACNRCALSETRTNVVFGVGRRDAEVMLVGEGPGRDEDLRGEPFVGRAGQLLDDMLAAVGLNRAKLYIANIVKCRPPQNRDPLVMEQEACIEWLRAQTALIKPKIIVCLGRIAAARIIGEDFRISRDRGQWFRRGQYWLTAIYHPAFLLRDPRKRPETFEDLKSLEAKIREVCERTDID